MGRAISLGAGLGWIVADMPAQAVRQQVTLQSLLQEGIRLFTEGSYPAAVASFDELERIFGREAEYRDSSVQRVILPMWGYAALVAGRPEDAARHFDAYLRDYGADGERKLAFVLFNNGQAYQALDDLPGAIERYRAFVEAFPTSPEAGIAQLRLAELHRQQDDIPAALGALDRLYLSRQAFSLRQQGRLRALQMASEGEDRDLAVRYLLETEWELDTMPEQAVLAFAALPLGDYLLAEEHYEEAIRAYRLVPSRELLIERQQEQLEETRRRFERGSRFVSADEAGIWTEYYRGMIGRLETLVSQLRESEPYTGSFYLRYGQAFSQAQRHFEAATVFREVAESGEFAEPLRQEAHYRWLVEIQTLERWSEALAVAFSFVDRYPDAPQAPLVLFLTANAHQHLREYAAAVDLLTRLLAEYPDHPFHGRWLFTRGFNYLLLEKNALARTDFADYLKYHAGQPLAVNAALWHALAWFFDKDYAPALEELDALLAATPEDHYLRPEVEFRRGAVLYAQRAYEPALTQLDSYLARFPQDSHRAEALVLRGDSLMGLGQLLPAALAFRQVGPEAGALFPYAVFQTGKIYRAMEEYERLATHFIEYVERDDLSFHPRVSEALYWVGWAREQQDRPVEALPIFAAALERYGNDPSATEIMAIFGSLHQLHQRLRGNSLRGGYGPGDGMLAAENFMHWLRLEQERALAAKQLTYYSRLRLYEADRTRAAGRVEQAREMILELGDVVPVVALDAQGLGDVGLAWQEAGREGAEAFSRALLERYPQSIERAKAYLALGRLAYARGALEEAAEWLRPSIESLAAHPLGPTTSLLYGRILVELGRPAEAVPVLEEILKLRSARGRPHAEALLVLGLGAEAAGEADKAIGYFQRIYNMYRAYPDLVGLAYLRSGELFERRGELRSAWRTYREILHFEGITDADTRRRAQREFDRLGPLLPPEPGSALPEGGEA